MMSTHAENIPRAGSGASGKPLVERTIAGARDQLARLRAEPGAVVGLVPTMGGLHEGHLSLVRAARADCDIVVVSIFINPIQFGSAEDLDAYPADIDQDLELLAPEGVDLVFAPSAAELYPPGFETRIEVGEITRQLCGQSRPGHFEGVATVVAKLFNIIAPGKAYFGEKDAQQVVVVRRMARDLDFGVEIATCPTVREADGLALSSRNSYLSEEERIQAAVLYESLVKAREAVAAGETSAAKLKRMMRKHIASRYLVEYEYARIVDPETLEAVGTISGPSLAAVAARLGNARLIDNIIIAPGGPAE